MSKNIFALACGFAFAAAGIVLASGCFTSPTAPSVLTAGGNATSGGGSHPEGDSGGVVPTPTPTTVGGGITTGSIQGTIANATGSVTVYANGGTHFYSGSFSGNGAFTLNNIADGTYIVYGLDMLSYSTSNNVTVVVTGGNAATVANLVF